jgi:hypothetical protein
MPDTALKKSQKFVPKCAATEAVVILPNVSYAVKIDTDTLVKPEDLKRIYYQLPEYLQSDRFTEALADGKL